MNTSAKLLVLALIWTGSAYGQGTASSERSTGASLLIEEITVTARKREENPLEISESLTVLNASLIENNNIDNLTDISNLVPNMYMAVRADGLPNVSIRGVGAFGNTQGVGFYLDDVQVYSDATANFGDIERVEVLKGPQGTLYGGSNIGGAVKFVTRKPDPSALTGTAKLGIGEDNYYTGSAAINVPLSSDWAVRVFAQADSDDSFLVNPNSPRANGNRNNNDPDIGHKEQAAARVSLAGSFTDRLSLFASVRYNDLDAPNNYWVRELSPNFEYPATLDTTFNPRLERDTVASTIELTYDFDNVSLTSLTGYSDTDAKRSVDIDLTQEYIIDSVHHQTSDTFSQEFRFTSTSDSPVQWLTGIYYVDYSRDEQSTLLAGAAFFDNAPTLEAELSPPFEIPFRNYNRNREQTAAFGNLSYRTDKYEYSVGARADRWTSYRFNDDSGLAGEQSDTEFLFRGSITRFFDDDRSMVYGLVSQGFEPGDFNLTNFAGAGTLFGYGPEEATNFELGYKGRLADDRAVLTVAAFLVEYDDRQFELQVEDPNGQGIVEGIINAGDSRQWGIEADIQYRLHENWTLHGGIGHLDAEWQSGTVSPINNADLSGRTPPQSPEWSGIAALSYNQDLDRDRQIFGRLQVQYKGEVTTNSQFLDVAGDDFGIWDNPSYTVVDLNLGMMWSNWELNLLVENLFDEDYYVDAQEFPNFAAAFIPQSTIIIGTVERKRRISAMLTYRFGE